VRVPGADALLIKGTGVCMGEMAPADAVLVTMDGQVLAGEHGPSCELAWHLAIYRQRADVGAVVHVHSPYATAWAVNNRVPPLLRVASHDILGQLGLVDVAPPGSPRLAKLVTAAFRPPDVRAVLLRDHGTVAVAGDIRTAVHLAEHVEDAAKLAVLAGAVADLPAA
jgi:ribulose-5-phosphate 4-epimerase/fuculose-1-phosphate aldolase